MILSYTQYKAIQGPYLQQIDGNSGTAHLGEPGYLRMYIKYLDMQDIDPIAIKAIRRYKERMIPPLLEFHHEYCESVVENINGIIDWIHNKYIA